MKKIINYLMEKLYEFTQNKKNKIMCWLFKKAWNYQYGDYTQEDWEQIAGEQQYDALKDDGYFDDPYDDGYFDDPFYDDFYYKDKG